jgi:hypothetical protein
MSGITLIVEGRTVAMGFWSPIASGEANDAQNVGGGAGIYRDKTGATINLRSLTAVNGPAVSESGDEVEIDGQRAIAQWNADSLQGEPIDPAAPTADQGLIFDGAKWTPTTQGFGDVIGPASSTDNALIASDGVDGKRIKQPDAAVSLLGQSLTGVDKVDGRDVSADGLVLDATAAIHADTLEPNGFLNRSDSVTSFDDPSRTFTIQPAVTSFDFYAAGAKFTKSSQQSTVIADAEGLHFLYFDEVGDLQSSQVFVADIIKRYAFVGIVYWDAANSVSIYLGEERHGATMDGETHLYLHQTRGAAWVSGLGLGNLDVDGSGASASHAQFSVGDGELRDEDIPLIAQDGSPQDLAPIAQIPVLYRTGAAGDWRVKAADNFPLIYAGTVAGYAGARPPFNEFTGGVWQLTEIGNNDFFLVHYFATNDLGTPIMGILGQVEYLTLIAARAGADVELNNLFTGGLPVLEFLPIATVIFQTANSYTNTPKARTRSDGSGGDYVDWRGSNFTPGSGLPADILPHAGSHAPGAADELLTPSASVMFGANSISATITPRYLFPRFADSTAQTALIQWQVERDGTLRNLHVYQNVPAGNGNNIVYTVRVNGVPTLLAVTMASTASSGAELVESVPVSRGDLVDIEVTKALSIGSSPSDIVASMEFAL